jgi:hypothetical protein
MRDREVAQAEVSLPGRDVVEGVVRAGNEVGGAHRLAQVAEAKAAARIEELAHDRVAVRRAREQVRRGIRDRRPQALDALIPARAIDGDRRRVGRRWAESAVRLLGQ